MYRPCYARKCDNMCWSMNNYTHLPVIEYEVHAAVNDLCFCIRNSQLNIQEI